MDANSIELLIIRHAETDYSNVGDRDGCDGDLTRLGEEQAVKLGERLKDLQIDGFITSSLLRAFKTAMGVANARAEKPLLEIMPEIVECGLPVDYYGCSEEYLQKYYSNAKMCPNLFGTEKYEFKMSYACNNALRAKKVIEYIKNNYSYGQRVALFSHHGMCEYLIREALNIENQTFDIALGNTSITTIQFNRNGRIVLHGINR